MNKKNLITKFSMYFIAFACTIVTAVFLCSNLNAYGASVGSLHVSADVRGSMSATYSQVDRFTGEARIITDMVAGDGSKTIVFGSSEDTDVGLLNPNEKTILLSAKSDLVLTYSFTAENTYYAGLTVLDKVDATTENVTFSYSVNDGEYKEFDMYETQYLKVEEGKTTTVSIKIHVVNTARNASMNGTIDWELMVDGGAYDVQEQEKLAETESVNTNETVEIA